MSTVGFFVKKSPPTILSFQGSPTASDGVIRVYSSELALSAAANELKTLEKSLTEKMQGLAQAHAQEHASTQNELISLQQQFQELSQSRALLEGQLHASHHQKLAVQDRVMDFEKRWGQLSHEQQQAHEMLMNLKSLVTSS